MYVPVVLVTFTAAGVTPAAATVMAPRDTPASVNDTRLPAANATSAPVPASVKSVTAVDVVNCGAPVPAGS